MKTAMGHLVRRASVRRRWSCLRPNGATDSVSPIHGEARGCIFTQEPTDER